MDWNTKTYDLLKIIKSMPLQTLMAMKSHKSGAETEFSFTVHDRCDVVTYELSWNIKPLNRNGNNITTTGSPLSHAHSHQAISGQMLGVAPQPSTAAISTWPGITPSSIDPIKRIQIVVCSGSIISMSWNELGHTLNSQYIYRPTSSGGYERDEGTTIMSVLPLNKEMYLVNSVLYDVENTPDAFLSDIDGGNFSVLEIIEALKFFKE